MTKLEQQQLRRLDTQFMICDDYFRRAVATTNNMEQAEAFFHKAFDSYKVIRLQWMNITADKI